MRMYKTLFVIFLALAAFLLGSCGGGDDDEFLTGFTGECPRGPLGYWDCNMTWDEQSWQ